MYTALYRAQRPEVFSEVLGQEHIVRILKNQIATDTVSHAYLFCGTRGTGKTTTARILAKAVNCLDDGDRPCGSCPNCMAIKDGTFMDVIEIDAASNNGVDNIRELRESVKYPPAVGKKKVYIIDEVHMLSTGASNALLKTLEEPPANVMFILATTDPQKLPQTILSRCMRLDFKRVAESTLIEHMSRICQERGVTISDGALRLLATNADGSVRDGLSILDQCLSAGDKALDREDILEFLGTVSEEFFIDLTEKVSLHNVAESLVLLDEALQEGKDVKQLMKDWMAHYRSLLITKYIKNPEDMLNMSSENIDKLKEQSNRISLDEINDGIITLSRTINDAKYSTQPRILLELAIVTIASGISEMPHGQPKPMQAATRPQQGVIKAKKPLESKPQAEKENAVAEKSVEAAKPEDSGQKTVAADYDLDELWNRIFEEGEDAKGSFNLIRTSTTLAAINDEEFKVIAQNDFTKGYVEKNQQHICEIMERIVGKRMKLICKTADQSDEDGTEGAAEELADEISKKFGIDVKVE
ncbi:DNA polymerase-3 subunit gamma/tau [Clostridiales Family XIII bacterium PM5-7]